MVTIDVEYSGGLRCKATHGPSSQTLNTDAPVDNHGKGEYFSPTDLVATALGACMATIMGIVADREQIDLAGLKMTVTKEMTSKPPRRIARLGLQIHMPGGLTDAQKALFEDAAWHCPVKQSLHPDVETAIEFIYS